MDVRHLIGKVAGVPRTRGMSLIYTLTCGSGENFLRVCVGMSPTDTLICWILVKLLYICLVPNFSACPRRQHLSRRWLFIIDG